MAVRLHRLSCALSLLGVFCAGSVAAQTYSKTEVYTYHDNTTIWVLGQTASVTCAASLPVSEACDGDIVSATAFDPTYALPVTQSAFGRVVNTYAYETGVPVGSDQRGTLKSLTDAGGHATTFTLWKRGIPQRWAYADSTFQTAQVDNLGNIDWIKDELGKTTSYSYDPMGRITRVTYPVGDTTAWNDMNSAFVSVATAEYGLAAGHWRETVSTGTATTVRYYDALWRPVLARQYDSANVAGTQSFVKTTFNSAGQPTFQSYPSASSTPATGTWTGYDSLGRVTSVGQDTELTPSLQVTTTEYLANFQTKVTNPRGFSTTTSFQAYDQPSNEAPVLMVLPEGVTTTIIRDPFGAPLSITRSGPSG